MENIIDENRLRSLCEGDQKAFEVFFLLYQPKLVSFLCGFIKDNEHARDIAQDIFLDIWNNKEKLVEVKSLKAYIFKMAKNQICNYYDHIIVNEKFVAMQLNQSSGIEDAEEVIFASQLQNMIDVTISHMPPQRKQIYIMSRVDGLSNTEIAEKLNIKKRTVENHLTAALADIRRTIKTWIILFV